MIAEYIEIVHNTPESLNNLKTLSPRLDEVILNILNLHQTVGVNYYPGKLEENFPDVPKDTPIRVGGSWWELCVRLRADALRKEGYQNVIVDKDISLSLL